jgi:hypothetical protein
MIFWDVMLYSLVDKYQHFGGNCYLHLQGRRVQQVPPKCWYISTKLHSIIYQKTNIHHGENLKSYSHCWQ